MIEREDISSIPTVPQQDHDLGKQTGIVFSCIFKCSICRPGCLHDPKLKDIDGSFISIDPFLRHPNRENKKLTSNTSTLARHLYGSWQPEAAYQNYQKLQGGAPTSCKLVIGPL